MSNLLLLDPYELSLILLTTVLITSDGVQRQQLVWLRAVWKAQTGTATYPFPFNMLWASPFSIMTAPNAALPSWHFHSKLTNAAHSPLTSVTPDIASSCISSNAWCYYGYTRYVLLAIQRLYRFWKYMKKTVLQLSIYFWYVKKITLYFCAQSFRRQSLYRSAEQ